MKFELDNMPGIVTVNDWTLVPNGAQYKYFWCAHWVVVTDKDLPITGFRSSEQWQLFAVVNTAVRMAIPGCGVKTWMRCECPPEHLPSGSDCFNIE